MKKLHFLFALITIFSFSACDTLLTIANSAQTGQAGLSESEIIAALKQALEVGTGNSVSILGKTDGFLGDPLVKIPFPPEALKVEKTLRDLGAGSLVDEFVKRMNRGAEDAAIEAKPIFVSAIQGMTITDAKNILMGADNAATTYFKTKTWDSLKNLFHPKIKSSMDKVGANKAWTEVTTRYNKVPFVTPVNTDVSAFATERGLNGLFLKLEGEELKIRKNPVARVSEILKKVFGELDKR